jgi:hypothetical protein
VARDGLANRREKSGRICSYGGCNELKAFVIRGGEYLYEVTATSISRPSPPVEGGLRARQVAVNLAGWLSRRTDGMTDRIGADAPED